MVGWPLEVRLALYTFAILIMLRFVIGTLRLVGLLAFVLCRVWIACIGRFCDEFLPGSDLALDDLFADWFVATESLLWNASLIFPPDDTLARRPRGVEDGQGFIFHSDLSLRVLASGLTSSFMRMVALFVTFVPVFVASVILSIFRSFFRQRLLLLVAIFGALWCLGFPTLLVGPLVQISGYIFESGVSLPTLLALGTLLAFLYAALNSDVRGRAELNKTASVACRTSLLRVITSLEGIEHRLARLRFNGISRLQVFPERGDIASFTGRDDFAWRGNKLLPRGSRWISTRKTANGSTLKEIIEVADESATVDIPQIGYADPSLEQLVASLRADAEIVSSALTEIEEAGYCSKIDRVVGQYGVLILEGLRENEFGLGHALDKPGTPWWETRSAPTGRALTVRAIFHDLKSSPDDYLMRHASENLRAIVRETRSSAYRAYWEIKLDCTRIRWLVFKVDSSLRPTAWERIRQFFGK
ncbi:hypothetical protein [Pseudonocardia acaciae]|uniref:hypothetical protein n=1 Tax=Pseudonocardia acaciae TaxID=551276 RepID=UPI0012ECE89D|nr:hypothetical protein [Pseudonocardia acaciae]